MNTDKLKLPGAAEAVEEALELNFYSESALCGLFHWTRWTSDDGEQKLPSVFAVIRDVVSKSVEAAFNAALALGAKSSPALTLGTLSGLIRPSDLRVPEEVLPRRLIVWAVGTSLEVLSARGTRRP